MWRLSFGCVLAMIAFGQIAFGQSPPPLPAFEVADIRINNSGPGQSEGDIANGRLTIRNVPLRYLIAEAWTLTPDQVSGPAWLDDVRVDVVAKAASPNTPDAEVRQMIQTLLKDRMKMVVHIEEREHPVWALTVWKGQPKMTPSGMPAKPEDADCSLRNEAAGSHLACKHLTMASLAHKLPQLAGKYADKPVVDKTGLEGAWDFTLEWMPLAQVESDGGMTLFAALQAQLGLQLEARKLAVPAVVIDSIERTPADN